jgi:tRNA-5-methyluridine54 2-sulfurtransferase
MEALPIAKESTELKCEIELDEAPITLTTQDKQFIQDFETKVQQTIEKYNLLSKYDKILVAASGGKDSTVALHLLVKLGYNIEAINIDTGLGEYSCQNTKNLEIFCKENNLILHKSSFKEAFGFGTCYMRDLLKEQGHNLNSCTICGVIRRVIMNKYVRDLGATKIVTGHNQDDEAESVMMNFFRNNLEIAARQGPISGIVKHKKFVPRVKPLYFCSIADITRYSKLHQFKVSYGACPCSVDAYRNSLRQILRDLDSSSMPGIQETILRNYVNLIPKLRKRYKKSDTNTPINSCKTCSEPTKQDICQSCKIINLVKNQ